MSLLSSQVSLTVGRTSPTINNSVTSVTTLLRMTGPQRKGQLVEHGVSMQSIADACGVSRPFVSHEASGKRHAQTEKGRLVRRAIARAIKRSVRDAFGDAA